MSKADQFRANALHEIGEDYQWGHEGTGGVAGNDDYDCSGFYHAMLTDVGVKDSRTTAEGYRVRGVRIVNPSRVGQDFAVLLRPNNTAHHIIPYIGHDDTVEAKGEAWGVVRGTVTGANARGAHWYRIDKNDLGALTGATVHVQSRKYPGHVLRVGDRGTDVRWIQKRLRIAGFSVAIDGVFGAGTAKHIVAFKKKHHRLPTSAVGRLTWNLLAK